MILAQVRLLYARWARNSVENWDSASLCGLGVGARLSAGTCCPLDTRQEASLLPIMTVERTTLLGTDWHLSSLLGNSSFWYQVCHLRHKKPYFNTILVLTANYLETRLRFNVSSIFLTLQSSVLYYFLVIPVCYMPCQSHSSYSNIHGSTAKKYLHKKWNKSSCLYRASMTIKTIYYPTDAQIYNSYIQLKLL